ncbi:urea carboxylase [Herbiconiux sp. 11R-BC]|uniref:urea carboxylase n=1 Tax=Herbiconiux sp. 11R-BC TaxID=3111637 RepID=UPI003C0489DE
MTTSAALPARRLGFDTVLVANRGEIACRIIRTARAMGLRTVAVYSEADRGAMHVEAADLAVRIGPEPARESYLNGPRILQAALESGAGAVHPGYGFLSENAEFARSVEEAGLAFVGPTVEQLRVFGDKHTAREAAARAGLPMVAGTGMLAGPEEAAEAAGELGYPVILKATGGGGGIGLQVCRSAGEVREAFVSIERLAGQSFGGGGVFAERFVENARHIEVQVFGDGRGTVVSLGDRDCTLQRRNQKVVEEAPAFDLDEGLRAALHATSRELCAALDYRSAGTVEFVYDTERREASFLEVNTRLQVEHPVTEAVTGVDLVEWMLALAGGDDGFLEPYRASGAVPVRGAAVEARVYAEDPSRGFQPSSGTVTRVVLPEGARVDRWVRTGTEVSSHYDPMLAKIIVEGADREAAWTALATALGEMRIDGIETNLGLLRAIAAEPVVAEGRQVTATLATLADPEPRIVVERPGLLTTVQDWPGRVGYWQVGVPPSGPMDDLSFRLGNVALGNPEGAPGLECTVSGPALRFDAATRVCVTGAEAPVTVDGEPVSMWEPVLVPAGSTLSVGAAEGAGLRSYVLVEGGLDVPEYLGSASTFTLGQFGGHGGRALTSTDVLRARTATGRGATGEDAAAAGAGAVGPEGAAGRTLVRPEIVHDWRLAVTEGPHGAPEFFTRTDIEQLYQAEYTVHFNSARTGVRLMGPRPEWARPDGGDAGLHPSNIHDNAYSIGAVDFTGDTPILLGPDGPSLGGFVCPVTVVSAERWKLGQLKPGDTVRFAPVAASAAPSLRALGAGRAVPLALLAAGGDGDEGVLLRQDGDPVVTYRRSGDDNLLVEYGELVLDLALRARVHALHRRVEEAAIDGVLDLTPGIRSLQVHFDPDRLTAARLLGELRGLEAQIPSAAALVVPSRRVRLPLSWDDPATREAIERYMNGVRDDAPWTPSNIEFIRRVNGLATTDDVLRTVFDAEYLVLGLGDVYLGAPVATPLDPRHRLVTTKYNPARTWTAENSVGIGGAYLCIYGMEGPGGYQFVGRTTQVWSRYGSFERMRAGDADAAAGRRPWLLDFFDRISWYPVSAEELLDLRADVAAGRGRFDIEDGTFSLAEHEAFLAENADSIAAFRETQGAAFALERAAWQASGEFDRAEAAGAGVAEAAPGPDEVLPEGAVRVDAPFVSHVWRVEVEPGAVVQAGDRLVSLEAMKMETHVVAPVTGTVLSVPAAAGRQVAAGEALAVIMPA